MKDNTPEIRGLLEEAQKIYLYYGVCDFTERVAEIKQLIHKALSLFPPVCGECGGSGKKRCNTCSGTGTRSLGAHSDSCPDCKGTGKIPCPCQAPVGEVEELKKGWQQQIGKANAKLQKSRLGTDMIALIEAILIGFKQACDHLTAQAKQIDQQVDFLSLAKEEMDVLQAENKRLKRLVQVVNDWNIHRKLHLRSDYPSTRCTDCDGHDKAIDEALDQALQKGAEE